jgi:SAM-dependent methyltransferase
VTNGATNEPDVEALVERLREVVAERRRSGAYPPGLEDDLEAHFRRIVDHRPVTDLAPLDAKLDRLRSLPGLDRSRIPSESGVPGGAALHRMAAAITARQVQGVLEQVEQLSVALQEVLAELAGLVRQPDTHVHVDLIGQVDALQARMAGLERGPTPSPAGMAELSRRLERLERAEADRRFRASFAAADFEAAFRGSEDDLKSRYQGLADRFAGHQSVLDIGCGRGEFIELLSHIGVSARGIELDGALAEEARLRGLDVEWGDGLAALGALPDGSLGGLVLLQVIEHLSAQALVDLVSFAAEKVAPGGLVVMETINPQSLYVYARALYLDPTHQRPVHPGYLSFLFEQAGFSKVSIEWRSPPPADEVLAHTGQPEVDANVDRLNQLLFGPQDYALIAVR